MKKYVYKPYDNQFPEFFRKEKERILAQIPFALAIEHVGSTAIEDLGGKGIIDIAIAVEKKDLNLALKELEKLDYEFRPQFSTPERKYLITYLPDPIEGKRRYHIHLTHPQSKDWKDLIGFRDFLRSHPEEAARYAAIKKEAVEIAKEDGEAYRKMKEPTFLRIHSKLETELP